MNGSPSEPKSKHFRSNRGLAYYKLLEALREPGCPICRLGRKTVSAYLEALLYENVNDPGVREKIQAAWGFCTYHSHELATLGDALGLGIIYSDLVSAAIEQLAPLAARSTAISTRKKRLPWPLRPRLTGEPDLTPRAICPACENQKEAFERYCEELMSAISEPEIEEAFRQSDGLCLEHLRQCLSWTRIEPRERLASARRKLAILEMVKFRDLAGELAELLRKFDYRYAKEPPGKESDSWRRAIAKISGTTKSCEERG